VDNNKLVVLVGPLWMRVGGVGLSVGGPSGVRNAAVSFELQVPVDGLHGVDQLLELIDLAFLTTQLDWHLLRGAEWQLIGAVEGKAGGVVASVLETTQAV